MVYCGKEGKVQLWNMNDQSTSQVDYTSGFDCEITLFRWHHTEPSKFVLGHIDGSLSLYVSGEIVILCFIAGYFFSFITNISHYSFILGTSFAVTSSLKHEFTKFNPMKYIMQV